MANALWNEYFINCHDWHDFQVIMYGNLMIEFPMQIAQNVINISKIASMNSNKPHGKWQDVYIISCTYGSGHKTAAVLLPGFAINW